MFRSRIAVVAVCCLASCIHTRVLEPAPGASLAPGLPNVARSVSSGVSVTVTGDDWNADPEELGRLFTPVHVTIANHSGKTLELSHRDFSLSGANGQRSTALAPTEARGSITSREPARPGRVQPAMWDGEDSRWMRQEGFDPLYFDESHELKFERLPTRQMLSAALPEGSLEDGRTASGFLYFDRLVSPGTPIEFEMTLATANDRQVLGSIAIPFVAVQR